jgi:hypothetical protein
MFEDGCPQCGEPVDFEAGRGCWEAKCESETCDWSDWDAKDED